MNQKNLLLRYVDINKKKILYLNNIEFDNQFNIRFRTENENLVRMTRQREQRNKKPELATEERDCFDILYENYF